MVQEDASVLHGVTIKLPKDKRATIEVPVQGATKQFKLTSSDTHLYSQVINLVPDKKNSQNFVPGKPFARSFSLVETVEVPKKRDVVATEPSPAMDGSPAKKKSKKSKKHRTAE
ncbi:hypothetical protein DYB32_003395 [Aphanomyces invadans]|uniref:Uncharacterized protein n=1 Tax=Aphanomyces invadans TaxID=157072 RepID=A0A3R6YBE5_9STRA|nr:hypothetical protein DYB32_003395 [Aphanomyces invadans]